MKDRAISRSLSVGQYRAKGLLFGSWSSQLGLMRSMLRTYGYDTQVITNLAGIIESRQDQPDFMIVVLDRNTSWQDVEQQLQILRELHKQPPLILIAPCNNPDMKHIQTLASIEDYLCLPLKEGELALRLEVCLSKQEAKATDQTSYTGVERRQRERRKPSDPAQTYLQIDDRTKQVLVRGETIALTPKEFELLSLLNSDPGKVFSIKVIRDCLWPGDSKANASDVQQYIHRLRSKVEQDPNQPCCIQTVKGFGYRLDITNRK